VVFSVNAAMLEDGQMERVVSKSQRNAQFHARLLCYCEGHPHIWGSWGPLVFHIAGYCGELLNKIRHWCVADERFTGS
jgi:hypothetical protein